MSIIRGFMSEINFANGRVILFVFRRLSWNYIFRSLVCSLLRGQHDGWSYLPSKGALGGVLILLTKGWWNGWGNV